MSKQQLFYYQNVILYVFVDKSRSKQVSIQNIITMALNQVRDHPIQLGLLDFQLVYHNQYTK